MSATPSQNESRAMLKWLNRNRQQLKKDVMLLGREVLFDTVHLNECKYIRRGEAFRQ